MNPREIEALLEKHLPDCSATVHSDDHVHYEAVIVSPAFAGQRQLARHRMVYAALGPLMGDDIHGLSIRTLTPEEHQAGEAG